MLTEGRKDNLSKLYKPVEDMVSSGLFVWDRDRNKPKAIRLPGGHRGMSSIGGDMRKRCPDSWDVLNKEIKNYNKLYGGYKDSGTDNVNTFSKGLNDMIAKIQSGVSACVKELRQDYIDLSLKFAKPLNQSYSTTPNISSKGINYLDRSFVNFVRGHWSSGGKLFEIKTQALSYSDFEDRCILANTGEGINKVYLIFHDDEQTYESSWLGIEKSYAKLKDFFLKDSHCWSKIREFNSFADSDLFKEFVSLPARCRDDSADIKSLKKAVAVVDDDKNRDTSFPDVLNYCKKELEKTSSVCSCGREDCSQDEDSFLSKANAGSKELCEGDSLNNAFNVCERRAKLCHKNCNNRLSEFKKKFKDVFFVSDLSLRANNIHVHFKTSCLADMEAVVSNYKRSVSRKPPYSGEEKVRSSVLSSFNNLGLVCEKPLNSLGRSFESLEKKCDEEKAEKEEKDKKKGGGLRVLSSDKGSSNNGSNNRRSPSSKKDRGVRSSGGNVNNEEFRYNRDNRDNRYSGGGNVKKFKGFGELDDDAGDKIKRGYETDEKYKRVDGNQDKREKKGSKELGGGKSLSGDSASLGSRVIKAPLNALSAVKSKVKEMGVTADKNIRDYLLKDNPSYLRYENGYIMTEEQRERMRSGEEPTGLSGIPKSLREKAYVVYNTMTPISDEEFRKRVGLMRHDVDLFEVNNLLFCRFCLTVVAKNKEQRDECGLPAMGKCGDLETVIRRYNELAEYQLIKPEEKKVIIMQKLEREREQRELANRGLTREERLEKIYKGLDEAERKAKKVRESRGMSF